jgi:hypothetical protein
MLNGNDLGFWRSELFRKRDISGPDGRRLYEYRIDEDELLSLHQGLRDLLATNASLSQVAKTKLHFPGLFVLYASEWWRLSYDGSGWSWDPILRSLGANPSSWTPIERSECIERGLRSWRLDRTTAGALRYLRAIALQGGLPLKLLAEARGQLGYVLRRTLSIAKGSNATLETIHGWIESLAASLPRSYRHADIYYLLADLIVTVMRLVDELGISQAEGTIEQLDSRRPGWRERFPLPIGDQEAQGLIDQLVRDASIKPTKGAASELVVERRIHKPDDEIWELHASVEAPKTLPTQTLRQMFDIGDAALPRVLDLVIEAGATSTRAFLHRLAGHESYGFDQKPRVVANEDAAAEHRLRISTADGLQRVCTARKGEALEPDLPWVFSLNEAGMIRFQRQGGGSITAETAWVAVPADWHIEAEIGQASLVAFLSAPERDIHEIQGKARILAPDGSSWSLRTGQADADAPEYRWLGDRVWEDFTRPATAYFGRPALYDRERRIPPSQLDWGDGNNPTACGPIVVSYRHNNELRYRTRLVVLPDEANLRMQPNDATAGTILFEGWRLAGARVLTPGVQTKTGTEGGALSLSLQLCDVSQVAPPEIDIELIWPRNPVAARLRLAYPAQGARTFDGMGNPLAPDDWIAAHRLAGVRIIAVGSLAKPEIRFGLRHTQSGQYGIDLSYPLRSDLNSQRLDIRLQDYADTIARLLGTGELLDAWVLVSFHADYREMLRLRVSRYVAPLGRDALAVQLPNQALHHLGTDQLRELPVLALRLDAPADEAVSLSPALSEGVPTGAWHFDPVVQGPGAWLIYPGQGADILFRPTLWQVGGGDEPRNSLARALAVEHREPRLKALDEIVAEMSADYAEPCWSDLERLAEHLGHLPLPTVDLWRRFSHSAAGMAALAAPIAGRVYGQLASVCGHRSPVTTGSRIKKNLGEPMFHDVAIYLDKVFGEY